MTIFDELDRVLTSISAADSVYTSFVVSNTVLHQHKRTGLPLFAKSAPFDSYFLQVMSIDTIVCRPSTLNTPLNQIPIHLDTSPRSGVISYFLIVGACGLTSLFRFLERIRNIL